MTDRKRSIWDAINPFASQSEKTHPQRRTPFATHTDPLFSLAMAGKIELALPEFKAFDSAITYKDTRLTSDGVLEPVAMDSGELAPIPTFDEVLKSYGMDSTRLKETFTANQGVASSSLFEWYASQGFIGYQACSIISQHWLVNKALSIPAHDACRNGFEIATDDDDELDVEVLAKMNRFDRRYKLKDNLIEAEINRRRFGFRIVIYNVESEDKDYYRKPFNIDGVKKGSYKGMSQVDPTWVAPILDEQAAADPASMHFYEPTWWMISGQLYHRSHLEVIRYIDPADVLKPTYQYGGIPLTQLILERVYAAERTANEGPMLVETKRLNVIYADLEAIVANPGGFEERLQQLVQFRDNYAVYVAGMDDRIEQHDTSLTDLDKIIMNQYQLVAATAGVPATKLLGTSPTGFNASGDYEQESYHEELETVQAGLTCIIDHHHELMLKSEMPDAVPKGENAFEIVTVWNPVGSTTAKEQAEINLLKAQEDALHIQSGTLDPNDSRNRLISDPKSGYNTLEAFTDDELEFGFGEEPELETSPDGDEDPVGKIVDTGDAGDKPGYVFIRPNLEDALSLHTWASKSGVEGIIRPNEFHLTIMHDSTGIDPYVPSPLSNYQLAFNGEIDILGGALVMFVDNQELNKRFTELQAMGAESDFDEFLPHVTLKYGATVEDLSMMRVHFAEFPRTTLWMGNETRQLT